MRILKTNGKKYTVMSWIYAIAGVIVSLSGHPELVFFFLLMAELNSVDELDYMSLRLTDEELDAMIKSMDDDRE